MKLTIIYDYFASRYGSRSTSPETIDIDDVDFHELLADCGKVTAIWCIEDVKGIRPDLTDDEAGDEDFTRLQFIDFDPSGKPVVIITVRGGLVQAVHSTVPVIVFVEDWDCPPDRPLIMDFESEPLTPAQQLRTLQRLAETNNPKGE